MNQSNVTKLYLKLHTKCEGAQQRQIFNKNIGESLMILSQHFIRLQYKIKTETLSRES